MRGQEHSGQTVLVRERWPIKLSTTGSIRRVPHSSRRATTPTGPGTTVFDLSVFKTFNLGSSEFRRLQFRAEAFNVFNTPQFNNPNAQIGSPGAGRITSAGSPPLFQRTSREIQLALKLYF